MTLTEEIRAAYDRVGEAWNQGPARVYRALAQPVLDAVGDVSGADVLDAGTGSGVLADALVRRGARVIGLDLSLGMLRTDGRQRPPAVVADVRALPVRSGAVDVVTASFVLNHLEVPALGLRECQRVLHPGGRVLATTFEGEASHPAKPIIEGVAARHGHVVPYWYRAAKLTSMPQLSTAERFAAVGCDAGLLAVQVHRVEVSLVLSPAELVGWRLGMPQLAPFVAGLGVAERAALVAEAEQQVAVVAEPVQMAVLLLVARA